MIHEISNRAVQTREPIDGQTEHRSVRWLRRTATGRNTNTHSMPLARCPRRRPTAAAGVRQLRGRILAVIRCDKDT